MITSILCQRIIVQVSTRMAPSHHQMIIIKVEAAVRNRTRVESCTTHNSTQLFTCVWHVCCIWKPKNDMCGVVCELCTPKKKWCEKVVCFSKKYSQNRPFVTKSCVLSTHIFHFFIFFASNDSNLYVRISCSVHGCSKLLKNMTALVFLVQIV